jgi:hypothetical protein
MTVEEQIEKAEYTYFRRRDKFMAEGMCDEEAERLAYNMMTRDIEHIKGIMTDDRRVCFECRHYANRLCTAITDKFGRPTMQLRFILQRCPKFKLRGEG